MEKFREFIHNNQWTIFLVVAGIILSALLFTIGFFKTVLLFIIVGICFFFGYTMDRKGTEGVKSFFEGLFKKEK